MEQREYDEWFAAKELKKLSKAELIELYHAAKINELRLANKLRKAQQELNEVRAGKWN